MQTDHVIALISAVRYRSVQFLERELKARGVADLRPSQGALLSSLWGRGGKATMRELLESSSRKKSTLTEMANKLERSGYLRRRPDPDDARGVTLELTEKAAGIEESFDAISGLLLERAWHSFTQDEKETLISLLERMRGNF
ncbi:MAG: MarR family transcriptional regulator [Spirochaetes bacterium]|nr:MarR family transcriptional regulator [Spirochaetota bacterium]